MKILRVKKTQLFDVFTGDGWKNHTRISVSKDGYVKFISGNRLTKFEVQGVRTIIDIRKLLGV